MARKKLKNRIAILLDRSSSMGSIRKEAVEMFNQQIVAIKKNNKRMDTTVSLFTFSTVADEPAVFNRPLKELKKLKFQEYHPAGSTAMYDSMGLAIDKLTGLSEMTDPNCSFLVIVVTDGEENSSRHFNGQRIADRIQLLQKTGKWTFTFCGANIDVEKMGQQLNLHRGNVMSFQSSGIGTLQMSASNAGGMSAFLRSRSTGVASVQSFYDQNAAGTSAQPDPNAPAATVTTTTKVKGGTA